MSNEDIEQKYFIVKNKYFAESLARLIDIETDVYGIVFCQTKVETREVGAELRARGYEVEILNGDMGQHERDLAMRNFKDKKVNLLVCTDVAARGIDVNNLTHVFNYGLPQDNESYVHRIGRTGRAGMKGKAYTIVGPRKAYAVRGIERHINKKIALDKLPSVNKLKMKLVDKELEQAQPLLEAMEVKGEDFKTDDSYKLFAEKFSHLSHVELLKLMFTWKFNKSLRQYDNLPAIEAEESASRDNTSRGRNRNRRSGGSSGRRSASGGGRDRSQRGRSRRTSGSRDGGASKKKLSSSNYRKRSRS